MRIAKTNQPVNTELVADAKTARELGYANYGKMREAQLCTKMRGEIKQSAAYARVHLGYTSMRERAKARTNA